MADRARKLTTLIPPLEAFLKEPIPLVERGEVPEQWHVFDRDSAQAIRAALASRRPLLVRGEPGVGKTQLAAAAAAKVLKRPLVTRVVDSRTESRDLLWTFDAVMRLADAQAASSFLPAMRSPGSDSGETRADLPIFTKQDLRKALDVADYVRPGPLWWAFDWDSAMKQATQSGTVPPALNGEDDPKNGRVVLIDEIDKADTDVPNGLLEALGAGQFSPQERAESVRIVEPFPLVIITTNEERVLPAPFVRRCFVLHLGLPDDPGKLVDLLIERATVHFPTADKAREGLFGKAARLIAEERGIARERFVKPLPGQAEYLDLLRAVLELGESDGDPAELLDSIAHYVLRKQESPGA
jgi:MoxR-like ATPase